MGAEFGKYLIDVEKYFVFGCICFLLGNVVVLVDICFSWLMKFSFLKIRYVKRFDWLKAMFCWSICAGFIGMLGALLNMYTMSLQAAAFVGVQWPIICARIVKNISSGIDSGEDRQEGGQ